MDAQTGRLYSPHATAIRRAGQWIATLLALALVFGGGDGLLPRTVSVVAQDWTENGISTLAAPASPPTAPGPVLQGVLQASVRIEHRINLPGMPSQARRLAESSSGTVVGPHMVLTHGHNIPFEDPTYLSERLIVSVRERGILSPHLVQVSEVSRPFADPSITLLVFPDRVPLGEPVTLGDPAALHVGDPVTVLYWDDAGERFATLQTTIAGIEGGIATLHDPARAFNQGDSGSGVYNARGELVGNVWSIVQSNQGQRLPWIEVGLLPERIGDHVL